MNKNFSPATGEATALPTQPPAAGEQLLLVEQVKTSIGRCFRIGSAEQFAQSQHKPRLLPSYACVYDDWTFGAGENAASKFANDLSARYNSHAALVAALEIAHEAIYEKINHRPANLSNALNEVSAALASARQ